MLWIPAFAGMTILLAARFAHALTLELPIDCTIGTECFVQNYVDHEPSSEYIDYACGKLSYDGHKGTDIRLRDLAEMKKGMPVLAAAPGKVVATRDGVEDVNLRDIDPQTIANRECGNGLVIDHGEDYVTQYCHMMKGSLIVRPGQEVQTGDVLGKVGLSGQTEFPHLHFEVRRGTSIIDPFLAEAMGTECGTPKHTLWSERAAAQLKYIPTALLGAGFATSVPTQKDVLAGDIDMKRVANDATPLVFWANFMGLESGDTVVMRVTSPRGETLVEKQQTSESHKAQAYLAIGKKLTAPVWLPGTYTGHVTLSRRGAATPYIDVTKTVRIGAGQ